MGWPDLSLRPGEHIWVFGGMFDAFYARAAGLEVRDTIACVEPGGWSAILLLRRPLAGTVADCILEHGTGGLWIDGCRVSAPEGNPSIQRRESARRTGNAPLAKWAPSDDWKLGKIGRRGRAEVYMADRPSEHLGRWPTNLVLIHASGCKRLSVRTDRESWDCAPDCPVQALDEMSLAAGVHGAGHVRNEIAGSDCGHDPKVMPFAGLCAAPRPMTRFGDSGGASRFFPQFANRSELLAWLDRLCR